MKNTQQYNEVIAAIETAVSVAQSNQTMQKELKYVLTRYSATLSNNYMTIEQSLRATYKLTDSNFEKHSTDILDINKLYAADDETVQVLHDRVLYSILFDCLTLSDVIYRSNRFYLATDAIAEQVVEHRRFKLKTEVRDEVETELAKHVRCTIAALVDQIKDIDSYISNYLINN